MQRSGTLDYRGLLASYWTQFGAALETQDYGAREGLDRDGGCRAGPSDGGGADTLPDLRTQGLGLQRAFLLALKPCWPVTGSTSRAPTPTKAQTQLLSTSSSSDDGQF